MEDAPCRAVGGPGGARSGQPDASDGAGTQECLHGDAWTSRQARPGAEQAHPGQIEERCREEKIPFPQDAGRGLLMRMLRESLATTGECVVTFGQYKNYLFKEVPEDYLAWAIKEWKATDECSPDLDRLARWADRMRSTPSRGEGYVNPEVLAQTPPPRASLRQQLLRAVHQD